MSSWKTGIVHWFDIHAGEGSIIDKNDGKSYFIHHSALKGSRSLQRLVKGQVVEFTLYENLYLIQIDRIRECKTSNSIVDDSPGNIS